MSKKLLIKLGTDCNLHCKHCHCSKFDISYNKDILKFINEYSPDIVVFGGGEPLMYFDIIKDIVESVKVSPSYRFVSNLFLLDEEKVEFLNNHNFRVGVSYDGRDGARDGYPDTLNLFRNLNHTSMSTTVYKQNMNMVELFNDLANMNRLYGTPQRVFPNFIHQTEEAPNFDMVDKDTVVKYIEQICKFLEIDILKYINSDNKDLIKYPFLSKVIEMCMVKTNTNGVYCCNEDKIHLAINGKFMVCPYTEKYIGDIYTGVDYDKVDSYLPDRCKTCELMNRCNNRCVMNITENECIIFKHIFNHYMKLINKYKLSEDSLNQKMR